LGWWWCDPSADPTPFAPLRTGRANPITDRLIEALDAARQSVRISSFYVKPVGHLRRAILAAARRGVRVQIFHSGRDALHGSESSWMAAAMDYPALLEAGVQVYEVAGGEHSKLVLVDNLLGVFGSYNLDHAAHDVVVEAMLASRDLRVVSALASVFEDLLASPHTVRVERARENWGLWRRAHARMLRPVRRWV
jgi:cardiolipin synthase